MNGSHRARAELDRQRQALAISLLLSACALDDRTLVARTGEAEAAGGARAGGGAAGEDDVNFRAGPSTSYAALRLLPRATAVVHVPGRIATGFIPVTVGGQSGWVSATLVSPTKPAPLPAAVPVTTYDIVVNEGRSRIWRVDLLAEADAPRPLTAPEVSSGEPAVSPDGRWLAFSRKDAQGKPQLHLLPLEGGEARSLTDLPLGVFDPRWLPDGTRNGFDLALTRAFSDALDIPIIASGGVGSLEHLAAGILEGRADAVLAASIFHYGEFTVRQAKEHMAQRGIEVRL